MRQSKDTLFETLVSIQTDFLIKFIKTKHKKLFSKYSF